MSSNFETSNDNFKIVLILS